MAAAPFGHGRQVLNLRQVSIFEPLHKVEHGIVRDSLRGQHQNRRLPAVSDLDGVFRPPDFAANIVAESGIAAQLHHAQGAALEFQINDRIINIAYGLHFRVSQRGADGMHALHALHALHFTHVPARKIKVMDTHIGDQTTTHFRIAELDGWRVGIARNGGEHHRLTDSAFFDFRLCRQVPGIETALKGHLKEHSRSFHRCNHLACAIQGQRDRLLAKDCLSTPCRIYDF